MTGKQLTLVKAALATLSQNKTYQTDIDYAKRCLEDAIGAVEVKKVQESDK